LTHPEEAVLRRRTVLLILLPSLALLAGCSTQQLVVYCPPPTPPPKPIVIIADGAGNFQGATRAIESVIAADDLPLELRTFEWSHGYLRVLSDHLCYQHARAQGERLAGLVLSLTEEQPGIQVHLVGHSAGSTVVLAAAECLPPDMLGHLVLLAPAVSAEYDLRQALRATRSGLEVYYSCRDTKHLGTITRVLGNSDRHWGPSSGRVGFQRYIECEEDVLLYGRLHQHPWAPCDRKLGNCGNHFGCFQADYLRRYVLPILAHE
jgi:pimeloyl-ACP methyl ester carboxylesterase